MPEVTAQQTPAPVQVPSQAIPFKREEAGVSDALVGGGAGVLVISLIVIAMVLYARKRLGLVTGAAAASGRLRIVETQRLGPRTLLSVVEFDGRAYLLAQTEQGVTRVADSAAGERL